MTKILRLLVGASLLLASLWPVKSYGIDSVSLSTNPLARGVSTDTESIGGGSPVTIEKVPVGAIPPKDPWAQGIESSIFQIHKAFREEGPAGAYRVAGGSGIGIDADRVTVIVAVETGKAEELKASLSAMGIEVDALYSDLIQAEVPISRLTEIRDLPGVINVRSPLKPVALSVVNEGLSVTGVNPWKDMGYNGRGVKIGVLDVGFEGYTDLLGQELPPAVTVKSWRTDGNITGAGFDHGTAVAEIVYDVAPEAAYYFANFETEVEFGRAVEWMTKEGVNIIVSAVGWPGGGPGDGTGAIANIVKNARAAGIFWTQAAGNFGQTHWTGPFRDTDGNGFHNFVPGDEGNTITLAPSGKGETLFKIEIVLTWDDWQTWEDDYDLFLFRGDTVVAQSTSFQGGKFPPVEKISYLTATTGPYWISIQRFKATKSDRLDLITTVDYNMEYKVPAESLVLPADSPDAIAVGAVSLSGSSLEPYSSQGPTKDGRIKPDLVAPDGLSTVRYGPLAFPGTSASAPLVAGIAALIKQAAPRYTPDQIQSYLERGATKIGDLPKNTLYGFGMVDLNQPPPPRVFLPMVFNGALLRK